MRASPFMVAGGGYGVSTSIGWIILQTHNPAQSGFESKHNSLPDCCCPGSSKAKSPSSGDFAKSYRTWTRTKMTGTRNLHPTVE